MIDELLQELAKNKDHKVANTILEVRAFMKNNEQEEAIRLCDTLLEQEVDIFTRANIYHEKYLVYQSAGNFFKAIEEITEAIQELAVQELSDSPKNFKDILGFFRYQRGHLYHLTGNYVNAKVDFIFAKKIIVVGNEFNLEETEIDSLISQYNLEDEVHKKMNNPLPPENIRLMAMAKSYFSEGDYESAIEVYSKLIRPDQDKPKVQEKEYYEGRADAYFALDRLSLAYSDTKELVRLAPQSLKANWRMGEILCGLGRPLQSIHYFETAIKLNGNKPNEIDLVKDYESAKLLSNYEDSDERIIRIVSKDMATSNTVN